jgi:chemotaxis protein CheD
MATVIVAMADCALSASDEVTLVTYALGSCIAVAIHDPLSGVGGLLHFMLPDSTIDANKAKIHPYMFADTGIPLLFRRAYELGAQKRRLRVRLIGGAQVLDDAGVFNIGKRNHLAARKILWKAGVLVHAEAVGGTLSRNVGLHVGTGRCWMRPAGGPEQDLPLSTVNIKEFSNGIFRPGR